MTLCDAGPLFALVDPRQAVLHQRCKAALSHLRSPLITTWPSFTEAMYLAHRSGGWPMQNLLWQYVREAVLVFHELGDGKGDAAQFFGFRGRPRERSVWLKPRRPAVFLRHRSVPKGVPRVTH